MKEVATSGVQRYIRQRHPAVNSARGDDGEVFPEDDAYGKSGPWRALPRSAQAGVAEMRP